MMATYCMLCDEKAEFLFVIVRSKPSQRSFLIINLRANQMHLRKDEGEGENKK